MNLHCLVGHQWDGCKCARCGAVRDAEHAWAGCLCTRCGLKRNQHHDWEVVECRQRCRRCGWRGESAHRFVGCVCLACGATRHVWQGNYCTQCHLICTHPETTSQMERVGFDDISTATCHGRVIRVCTQCGQPLGELWKK